MSTKYVAFVEGGDDSNRFVIKLSGAVTTKQPKTKSDE